MTELRAVIQTSRSGRRGDIMTDFERVELFAALTELSRRYPNWRIGQLVANVAGWADADI